jgi:hypothetical protein
VQTFAGHASLQVTMDRYGHRFPSNDHRKAMNQIAGGLFIWSAIGLPQAHSIRPLRPVYSTRRNPLPVIEARFTDSRLTGLPAAGRVEHPDAPRAPAGFLAPHVTHGRKLPQSVAGASFPGETIIGGTGRTPQPKA